MYLRLPRIFFFLLTSALSCITFALASWGLAVGESNKKQASQTLPGAKLHIADALGVGGAVTAAAGVASLLCLAGLFLLFFRAGHPETIKTVRMKEAAFSFASILWIATLIPATVIMAKRSGYVTAPGVPDAVIAQLVAASGKNLAYRDQTAIKAYVATGWVAFVSTVINLILVSLEARHVLKNPTRTDGVQGDLIHSHQHHQQNASTLDSEKGLNNNSIHHHENDQDEIKSEKMMNAGSVGSEVDTVNNNNLTPHNHNHNHNHNHDGSVGTGTGGNGIVGATESRPVV